MRRSTTSSSASSPTSPATKVGDGMDPESRMGPLANPCRVDAIEAFVNDAQEKGAKVATGGTRVGNQGNFFQPAVLGMPESARIMHAEPFGPVAVMLRCKETDDRLSCANRLALWSRQLRVHQRRQDHDQAGRRAKRASAPTTTLSGSASVEVAKPPPSAPGTPPLPARRPTRVGCPVP